MTMMSSIATMIVVLVVVPVLEVSWWKCGMISSLEGTTYVNECGEGDGSAAVLAMFL